MIYLHEVDTDELRAYMEENYETALLRAIGISCDGSHVDWQQLRDELHGTNSWRKRLAVAWAIWGYDAERVYDWFEPGDDEEGEPRTITRITGGDLLKTSICAFNHEDTAMLLAYVNLYAEKKHYEMGGVAVKPAF